MKTYPPLRFLVATIVAWFCLSSLSVPAARAELSAPAGLNEHERAEIIHTVTAADDERVAAIVAVDIKRINASFSDELRYGHSNGRIDNKTSYVSQFETRRSLYEKINYKERVFTVLAPEVVQMAGRVLIHVHRSDGSQEDLDMNYLGIWRKEKGQWKFLAWQSTRAPTGEKGK